MNTKKTTGLSALITGGTSGLGLELSKHFMAEGFKIYILGRRMPASFLENESLRFIKIDLSDLRSTSEVIRSMAADIPKLDIIVNNAGVLSPPAYTTSSDGIEYTFQVNWLSHLIINEILIREGRVSPRAKIVSVTSPVYKYVNPRFRIHGAEDYSGFRAYAESKYYMLLTGRYLNRVFPENELKCFSFNPGTFSSGIARMQSGWFRKLYKVGAPFLRSPARPALKLFEILKQEALVNGAIYSSPGSLRHQETFMNGENPERFIEETIQLTSRFLIPGSIHDSINAE